MKFSDPRSVKVKILLQTDGQRDRPMHQHQTGDFLLYSSVNYRDFSVESKLIISLTQTVKLSLRFHCF